MFLQPPAKDVGPDTHRPLECWSAICKFGGRAELLGQLGVLLSHFSGDGPGLSAVTTREE